MKTNFDEAQAFPPALTTSLPLLIIVIKIKQITEVLILLVAFRTTKTNVN